METRKCTKCYEEKLLEEYYNRKKGKYGKSSYCKECAKKEGKRWRSYESTKNNTKEYNRVWSQKQRDGNTLHYFRETMRNHVRRYIIDKRGKHTEAILGETFDNVRLHIEKQFKDGMSWDNFGEWHIDHIIPLSSGKNREEIVELNNYKNLQPLWAKENLQKGARV